MADVIKVDDLSIRINNRVLVKNVSFSIEEGEAVLLSGANGIGKSTLLKSIMHLQESNIFVNGSIKCGCFEEILTLDRNEIQKFRSSMAYIQQKDEYAEMGDVRVGDIISELGETFGKKRMSFGEVNDLIDEWIPRKEDNCRVFDAKSKPSKLSGGEQRLLSVLSVIATRSKAKLFLIDEPLNNLDFANARNISNLLNRAIKNNPQIGLLMVSHCRIFPFITREIKLTPDGIIELPDCQKCYSCFGEPDQDGFYH